MEEAGSQKKKVERAAKQENGGVTSLELHRLTKFSRKRGLRAASAYSLLVGSV